MVQGDDEPTEEVSEEDHDLGDCKKLLIGYICEECRVWYQEQAEEWEYDELSLRTRDEQEELGAA